MATNGAWALNGGPSHGDGQNGRDAGAGETVFHGFMGCAGRPACSNGS